MNKITITLLALFLLVLPTISYAHTGISTSHPSVDEVVTEELKEITLTYEGKIEELSTMTLVKDGEEVSFSEIKIDKNFMTGTVSESLENGTYVVNWNVVGEDGHPISGEIPFTVQVSETTKEVVNEKVNKEVKEEVKTEKSKENINIFIPSVVGISAIILLVWLKRKGK